MAYEKTSWGSTTPVNPTNLNKIEEAIEEIYNLFYPVGTYYETSNTSFDPNATWGGTWELETDGTILVSKSNDLDSKFNSNVGNVVGEESHQLTKEELPQIDIKTNFAAPATSTSTGDGLQYGTYSGSSINTLVSNVNFGEKAHNNVQPSKIVNRWHRTA